MGRMYVDCRDHPSASNCTLALCADSKEELMDAVVQHAKLVHGADDSEEFRQMVQASMKEGSPPT